MLERAEAGERLRKIVEFAIANSTDWRLNRLDPCATFAKFRGDEGQLVLGQAPGRFLSWLWRAAARPRLAVQRGSLWAGGLPEAFEATVGPVSEGAAAIQAA